MLEGQLIDGAHSPEVGMGWRGHGQLFLLREFHGSRGLGGVVVWSLSHVFESFEVVLSIDWMPRLNKKLALSSTLWLWHVLPCYSVGVEHKVRLTAAPILLSFHSLVMGSWKRNKKSIKTTFPITYLLNCCLLLYNAEFCRELWNMGILAEATETKKIRGRSVLKTLMSITPNNPKGYICVFHPP